MFLGWRARAYSYLHLFNIVQGHNNNYSLPRAYKVRPYNQSEVTLCLRDCVLLCEAQSASGVAY